MSVQGLVLLACGVAVPPMALWFYPHCARPSLAHARARPAAFLLAQAGTVAAVIVGIVFIADVAGLMPRGVFSLAMVLVALWALPAAAYLRPMWLVRATGGPIRA